MTISIDLDPSTNSTLILKLYNNVTNVVELREKIIKGVLNCCIIKPKLIIDPFQVIIAANKAVVAKQLTTKTISSEILFNLSISKNINQSLQKFGIDDKVNELLIAVVIKKDCLDDVNGIFEQIKGNEISLLKLNEMSDLNLIKKEYKIDKDLNEKLDIINVIVSKIVTKDFLSH